MSNPSMEAKVKELMELKRMKEELEAEIAAAEDEIKAVMGEEEILNAGVFKVTWKTVISTRLDSTALKKSLPEIAERFMKQTTTRRFCVNEKDRTPTTAFGQRSPVTLTKPGSMFILPHELLPTQ